MILKALKTSVFKKSSLMKISLFCKISKNIKMKIVCFLKIHSKTTNIYLITILLNIQLMKARLINLK